MNVAAILKLKGREVITAPPDTPLLEIAKLLGIHRIGCIVIAEDDGKVIGIVSERDIVREIARAGAAVLKEPVEACMTKSVVTCRESDTTDQLMGEMTAHRFRHMPVVTVAVSSGWCRSVTWCGCVLPKRRWKRRRCANTSRPADRDGFALTRSPR